MVAKMSDIQIRAAVATDINDLMHIDHSWNSDYVWQLQLHKSGEQVIATLREVRLPHPIHVTYPRDVLSLVDEWNNCAKMFVAVVDDEKVGYVRIIEQGTAGAAWVTDLVVSFQKRRLGYASTLIQSAQDWALEKGLRQIYLEMPSKNFPAIRLAQKLGYEFCGYNDHYYATQDIALFFGRMLK